MDLGMKGHCSGGHGSGDEGSLLRGHGSGGEVTATFR